MTFSRLALILCLLIGLAGMGFAQQPSRGEVSKSEKPDPLALTQDEVAALNPIITEYNKWGQRLTEALNAMEQSESAPSRELEQLALLNAAKDARSAQVRLKAARAAFADWESKLKRRANCEDCRFDEASGRLVKATVASK
jgi:hypothetical protein